MNPYTTTSSHPSRRRRLIRSATATATATAAVAAVVVLGAGCSDESASSETTAPRSTSTVAATTGHDHVEVRAVDFDFEGLPKTIEAGTRLTLTNGAPREMHELVAFRLPDDEDRPVADLLKLPETDLGPLLGQPTTVLLAAPGADQIPAVGDGTLTEPGRYLVMCSIPTGVDPAEYLSAAAASAGQKPDVPGGPPHFTSGMFAELTVR